MNTEEGERKVDEKCVRRDQEGMCFVKIYANDKQRGSSRQRSCIGQTRPGPGAGRLRSVRARSEDHSGRDHERTEDRRFRIRHDTWSHSPAGRGQGISRPVGTGHEMDH